MRSDLPKYLRGLRIELDRNRQNLIEKARLLRVENPQSEGHQRQAEKLERAAKDEKIRASLLGRILDNKERLADVFDKAQENPRLFVRAINDAYHFVCRNYVAKERKTSLKKLEEKFERLANELLSTMKEAAEITGNPGYSIYYPGSLAEKLEQETYRLKNTGMGYVQMNLGEDWDSLQSAYCRMYLELPRQKNPHGNFVQYVDLILKSMYLQETIDKPSIRLSDKELATLAEVCLDLPRGSVNPDSIGFKRVKLDA